MRNFEMISKNTNLIISVNYIVEIGEVQPPGVPEFGDYFESSVNSQLSIFAKCRCLSDFERLLICSNSYWHESVCVASVMLTGEFR